MSKTEIDWSLTQDPEIIRVTEIVAGRVAREYSSVTEKDDLIQEAYILIATNPSVVRGQILAGGSAYLNRWIWSRLVDQLRPQAKRSNRLVSLTSIEDVV